MVMTPAEIVAEYKQAKSPLKQIKILADQNVCKPTEIVQILRDARCYIPGQYMPKASKTVIETPEAPKQASVLVVDNEKSFNGVALAAIIRLMSEVNDGKLGNDAFVERVRGVLAVVMEGV